MRTTQLLALCLVALGATMPAFAQVPGQARSYRVLLVGNSLTYTNNLPALLRAVGNAQGTPITTETYAAPGGLVVDRWNEGHVADALRERKFDAVVIQERGGHLACMASAQKQRTAPCAASLRAHKQLAELATEHGAKTWLFATWGPDADWQARLDRGLENVAKQSNALRFDAAGTLDALRDAQPNADLLPDGTHPSVEASLMLALALYRDITGNAPIARALRVDAPLLPVNAAVSAQSAMESQPGLRGDGKVTVVPANLLEPLLRSLPAPGDGSAEVGPARRRR